MGSRLILLLVQCLCSVSFLRVASTQMPAQYVFTPRDYQRINELALPDSGPFVLYYAPVLSRKRSSQVPRESVGKALLLRQVPYMDRMPGYPSAYLQPPAPDSVSHYANFRSHLRSSGEEEQEVNALPQNHRLDLTMKNKKSPKKMQDQGPVYVRDHAPIQQTEAESEATLESKVSVKKKSVNKEPPGGLELSADGDRIEFQIQGHEGPKTYIFGFDTGDGKNRQFRLEERLKDGTVKGHYGYYDARGKLRTIRYLARPIEGYQEKHHESNRLTSEEE